MTVAPKLRVVFDTNVVISALVFATGRLAWLREHWRAGKCIPLVSRATAHELVRVLAYPKFRLSVELSLELQGDYLPYCESVDVIDRCPVTCRDVKDQSFLDLAHCGEADVLVSGDDDLLSLAGKTKFAIETHEVYRLRDPDLDEWPLG